MVGMTKPKRYERIVIKPDTHVPHHDPRAFSLFLKIISDLKPTRLIDLGDAVSFDSISHWPKAQAEPDILAEKLGFVQCYKDIRSAVGKACKFQFIEGNHEYRLRNYMYGSARELSSLECLRLQNLLEFKELGIDGPHDRIELCGSRLVAVHGWPIIRRWPGMAANEWMTREGRSGVSGHTHTLAIVGRRRYDGAIVWAESGFLGRMDQPYLRGQHANWSHGFVWLDVTDNDFQIHEVRFHTNFSWRSPGGKEYRA